MTQTSIAQSQWKMQDIRLPTKWAKEVTSTNVLKEYPRPQMVRTNWQNLNGLWEYAFREKDAPAPQTFDGSILVPFPVESALSGVQRPLSPEQCLWYKKNLHKPSLASHERLILHFGAVDWQATVFINGREVGRHQGGYTSFSFDITEFMKAGSNELLVQVYDPTDTGLNPHGKQTLTPRSIFYTPSSGIWQTVWLEKVPATYIKDLRLIPDIDHAVLNVIVTLSDKDEPLQVELTAKAKGEVITTVTGTAGDTIRLPIPNAHLWSPNDPFLYRLNVKLMAGSKKTDSEQTDRVESYFGMRKVTVQKDARGIDRIFLNNKYVYNLGTLDQGFWPDGLYTAPTDEALAFDIQIIKAMGFNTIRKHIKIEPARWYYHADKIGVMVWQDFVNPPQGLPAGTKDVFEKEVKETMDELYNHPSITTWVLFNEQWGAYDQQRLTEWVKHYDSTRLVDGHSGELLYVNNELREPSEHPWVSSDLVDIHSYPNPMKVPLESGKVSVLGEFGGIGVSVTGHEYNDLQGWGYIQASPRELKQKYTTMIMQLKQLEAAGVSGAIYTQSFDVESEENGLLTYDREIIKIPLHEIRRVNASLIAPADEKRQVASIAARVKTMDMNDNDSIIYPKLLRQYEEGKKDSALLRRLIVIAYRTKDQQKLTTFGRDYILGLQHPYSRENLKFIKQITRTSNDKGFEMFWKNHEKVDSVLGKNQARELFNTVIRRDEIPAFETWEDVKPDWDTIEKRLIGKYGAFAEENILGVRMAYYWLIAKNRDSLSKYYLLYFNKALDHSEYNINNASWAIFEQIDDPKVLEFAADVSKYNIEHRARHDPYAVDTYANLLYKLGKTKEAIEWETKAVAMSKNATNFVEYLNKMKNGEPTWPGKKDAH